MAPQFCWVGTAARIQTWCWLKKQDVQSPAKLLLALSTLCLIPVPKVSLHKVTRQSFSSKAATRWSPTQGSLLTTAWWTPPLAPPVFTPTSVIGHHHRGRHLFCLPTLHVYSFDKHGTRRQTRRTEAEKVPAQPFHTIFALPRRKSCSSGKAMDHHNSSGWSSCFYRRKSGLQKGWGRLDKRLS